MKLNGSSILITGGCGFIGSHLVERVLDEDVRSVTVLDNLVAGTRENLQHIEDSRLSIVIGDVANYQVVEKLVQKADVVFHQAASKMMVSRESPRIDLETNILGTFNILEACRGADVRVIYASTGSVLGSSDEPMSETHPANPSTLYGISKYTAEKYCRFYAEEFGVRVSMLRYFHVFGPRQDYAGEAGVVSIFLSRFLAGKSPVVNKPGDQIRCLTFVKDTVEANMLLVANDESIGETYNIAAKTRISVTDLARTIRDLCGREEVEILSGDARPGENLRPVPDTTKIETLGFSESWTFQQGLQATKTWVEKDMLPEGGRG